MGTNITEWMTIIFKTKNDLQGNLTFNLSKHLECLNYTRLNKKKNLQRRSELLKARIKIIKKKKLYANYCHTSSPL